MEQKVFGEDFVGLVDGAHEQENGRLAPEKQV